MRFLKVLPFVGLSVTAFSLVALVLFTGVNPDTLNGDDSDDFEPFSVPLHGVNYYPQKTPWSLFWKHYDAKVVSSDLAKIKSMGFNTVRIFLPYPVFESKNRQIRERALRSTQNFLLQAEQYNLRCVLTLFDFYQDYGNTEAAIRHLQRIVPALKTSKALFAWDLKNELDRDEVQGHARLQFWINQNIERLRQLDAEHLITIGWSQPEAILKWSTAVDYDTFHYYGRVENLKRRLEPIRLAMQQNKHPQRKLVMGEFGYHTWSNDPKDPHIAEHQYNYVNAILASRLSLGLAGSMVWNLYDYAPELKEDWVLQQHSFQYHMGLLDINKKPKPAAKAFQQALFVRDAETLGEPTLNTRRLELVLNVASAGDVVVRTDVEVKRWFVQPGVQQLSWSVTASEIKALIYLKKQYQVETPALISLAGERSPSKRHKLTLRLR